MADTTLAEAVLLGALDAIARGRVEPTAAAVVVAVTRHPVLGRFDPSEVIRAIRRTCGPAERDWRRACAEIGQRHGSSTSEASLWLAELEHKLAGHLPAQGLWVDEAHGHEVRFEVSPDGDLIPAVMRHERSDVEGRIRRLIALYRAFPHADQPCELFLNHGAGRARPEFLIEHERREGITRHEADSDWRRAKRRLIARGECGTLTPFLVAYAAGDPEAVRRERSRLRRFRKRTSRLI